MYRFELPSGTEVELREMTGAEEDLLTNEQMMRSGEGINQVFANCVLRIGENESPGMQDVMNMLSGDRAFVLVRLRQVSLGDEVDLDLKCTNPACGADNFTRVDLRDLEVDPYGEGREFDFTLPKSGKKVRFCLMDGHKETRLAQMRKRDITTAMLLRIISIDEEPPSKKAMNEMPLFDRNALRAEMASKDGGIDTTIETTCYSCGSALQTRLEAEPSFLFPKAVR